MAKRRVCSPGNISSLRGGRLQEMKEMKKENGKEEERGKEAFILSTTNFIR
jgi:hypothetical protein